MENETNTGKITVPLMLPKTKKVLAAIGAIGVIVGLVVLIKVIKK